MTACDPKETFEIHTLFDDLLIPSEAPDEPHECASDVAACRHSVDKQIFQELFRRLNGTLGFRYIEWVAWRDAGGNVVRNSWYTIDPDQNLIADAVHEAMLTAESHAASKGLTLSEWTENPPF